jgi:Kef-type K+ transport system membrane component KefB/Trk K+ transport system NAD-binding subunit
MAHQSTFATLLLITGLAVVVPVLSSRLRRPRIPIVVGEILAGILIGKSGLNLVEPSPVLTFLEQFGFTFLMFLSGLDIRMQNWAGLSKSSNKTPYFLRPLSLSLLHFLFTLLCAGAIGAMLAAFDLTRSTVLLGLILSTTSLGIVVPTLKERGLTGSVFGQSVLLSALVSDFVTLLLLSLFISFYKGSRGELLLFVVLLAAFFLMAVIGRRIAQISKLTKFLEELSHATAQIRVRGAFALLVIWVAAAEALGIEVILGAFLAGAILSVSSERHESPLHGKLDAIGYGFFVPIFFIMVGVEFDLRAVLSSRSQWLLVPILIIAAYFVKLVPALIYRLVFTWQETLAAGSLLASRLSLIVATSAIALELDLISAATNSAIILMAVVTCTASPILFSRILPLIQSEKREGVFIAGTDQLAILLGQWLKRAGEEVTFLGCDRGQVEHLKSMGMNVIEADPGDPPALGAAGLGKARVLIVMVHSPEVAFSACRAARYQFEVPVVIARADDPQLAYKLQALQVRVVQSGMAIALAIAGALRFPTVFAMLTDAADGVDVLDVRLGNAALAGQPLRRIKLPGDALVLAIHRAGEVIVPHGDTVLHNEDVLAMVGSPESLQEARSLIEEEPIDNIRQKQTKRGE